MLFQIDVLGVQSSANKPFCVNFVDESSETMTIRSAPSQNKQIEGKY